MTGLSKEIPAAQFASAQKMQVEAHELGFLHCLHALRRTLYATPIGWALVVLLVNETVSSKRVMTWLGLFAIGWCLNLLTLRRIAKSPERARTHHLRLSLTAAIDGACWGLVVLFLMAHDHRLDAWLVIVLCGVASVNLPTYIAYPQAFRALAASMWLSATFSAFALKSQFDAAPQLIFALFVYLGLLVYTIRPVSVRVIEGIRLQLENANLTEELRHNLVRVEQQASTDALTGQMNRRALDQALKGLIHDAGRYGRVFSLLMLDVDYFKRINDSYGHAVGDQALQSGALRIAEQLRGGDLCARFGGEEFVVLLPSTDLTQACEVAERIRAAFALKPLATQPALTVTVSIGVAVYEAGLAAEKLLAAADGAVYEAKNKGRNQVQVAKTN